MNEEKIAELRARQAELDQKEREAQRRLYALRDKLRKVQHEIAVLTYTCGCVRLNEDIGIHDMPAQEAANRQGLGLGFVREVLSAVKDCPNCGGWGSREEREKWERVRA